LNLSRIKSNPHLLASLNLLEILTMNTNRRTFLRSAADIRLTGVEHAHVVKEILA
jgi:hypothetical protein